MISDYMRWWCRYLKAVNRHCTNMDGHYIFWFSIEIFLLKKIFISRVIDILDNAFLICFIWRTEKDEMLPDNSTIFSTRLSTVDNVTENLLGNPCNYGNKDYERRPHIESWEIIFHLWSSFQTQSFSSFSYADAVFLRQHLCLVPLQYRMR